MGSGKLFGFPVFVLLLRKVAKQRQQQNGCTTLLWGLRVYAEGLGREHGLKYRQVVEHWLIFQVMRDIHFDSGRVSWNLILSLKHLNRFLLLCSHKRDLFCWAGAGNEQKPITTPTNLQFLPAMGNEQLSCTSCSLIPLLWILHRKRNAEKLLKTWAVLHGMAGHSAAMLFSASSKTLDIAAVPVPITPSSKTSCWLVWHLTLSPYFRLQRQELTSLMEIILLFVKPYIQTHHSRLLKKVFSSPEILQAPVCTCFMDIFSRNLGCCCRHLS